MGIELLIQTGLTLKMYEIGKCDIKIQLSVGELVKYHLQDI